MRAVCLWTDGRPGSSEVHPNGVGSTDAEDVIPDRMDWTEFADDAAPGWRMLSSLPSCPNPHMRFPMSRDLLDAVRGAEDLRAAYM